MLSPEQNAAEVLIASAAIAAEAKLGIPPELSFAAFTVSQCNFESGYLKRAPKNNCFGIKPDHHGAGVQYFISHEYLNGKWEEKPEQFEAYDSLADCFADHCRLIQQGPYAQAWADFQGSEDLDSFIIEVSHIYATSPIY